MRRGESLLPILADPGQLSQVLIILAVNARDAMPRGGNLAIATEAISFDQSDLTINPETRAGVFACLSVSDTGTGIAPDVLPQISSCLAECRVGT